MDSSDETIHPPPHKKFCFGLRRFEEEGEEDEPELIQILAKAQARAQPRAQARAQAQAQVRVTLKDVKIIYDTHLMQSSKPVKLAS